jgi:hypothetical protein
MDLLVHHPAPRSCRSTRTLGPRSWSTLPSSQLLLVLPLTLLSSACPPPHYISTPGPLPAKPSTIPVHRPRSPVHAFLISIILWSPLSHRPCNLLLSLPLHVFLAPASRVPYCPLLSLTISYLSCSPTVYLSICASMILNSLFCLCPVPDPPCISLAISSLSCLPTLYLPIRASTILNL